MTSLMVVVADSVPSALATTVFKGMVTGAVRLGSIVGAGPAPVDVVDVLDTGFWQALHV